ncbi:MAG: pyruvate dehydrogenase (acetyl-transferring) E1 component subunit alpha [Chloroflexi bacterium]|nr:pyruvate dehydrogenase (acetyl-transferring) E1 component subunit alpha [Chloroflexota bacterium]
MPKGKREEKSEADWQLDLYYTMSLIRRFEERSAEMYAKGKIRGFLHLYIGEEAIAVGALSVLQPQDYVVTHYRDHGHALARGMDPKAIMAELFGKATGCSKGMGGSMHLFDVSKGFMGGYAIVGGQLPIAAGLALASKYKKEDRVVICFFGDGALNQGEFHEAMNLASLWKLPVLFFLENNLYGMGTSIDRTYAGHREIFRAADHYAIPCRKIDGMDVLEVRSATRAALDGRRAGHGPFLMEALTYRFRGHSMADPVDYRKKSEEEEWKKKDPLVTFKAYLLEEAVANQEDFVRMEKRVEEEVEEAIRYADESPPPPLEALYENVYAD